MSSTICEQPFYIIFALRRSGHHAVANWIQSQIIERVHMLDFCDEYDDRAHKTIVSKKESPIIFQFENQPIDNVEDYCNGNTKIIICLRDPYNNIASYIKRFNLSHRNLSLVIKMWKVQADLFLSGEYHGISYNDWFKSMEYRRQFCEELGLTFTDVALNRVAHQGGGSSFDKMDYNGEAQKMDVFNRWQNYKNDPLYNELVLQDKELKEISDEIFGPIIEEN